MSEKTTRNEGKKARALERRIKQETRDAKSASETARLIAYLDEGKKKAAQRARGNRPWMPEFSESEFGARMTQPSGAGGGAELVDIKLTTPLPSPSSGEEMDLTAHVAGMANDVTFRVGGGSKALPRITVGAPLKRSVKCVRGVDYLDLAQLYDEASGEGEQFEVHLPDLSKKKEEEDDEAVDRLFGEKAYLSSQSDGTITG